MPIRINQDALIALADKVVVIVLIEHLGDIIACEPVIRHVKKNYPGRAIAWLAKEKYFEALAGHPDLDYLLAAEHLVEATAMASDLEAAGCVVINLHFNNRLCLVTREIIANDNDPEITSENYYTRGSLLEAFSLCARLPKLSNAPQFFILPDAVAPPLPQPYVVFHCRSNEEDRDWDDRKWKKLFYFFVARGIHAVEIGFEPVLASVNAMYHDCTNVRSIQSIARIIEGASFFFGVDSSFAHLANSLDVNGLVIMGRYRAFTHHVPYTGKYRENIVRRHDAPAKAVTFEDVREKYCELTGTGSF